VLIGLALGGSDRHHDRRLDRHCDWHYDWRLVWRIDSLDGLFMDLAQRLIIDKLCALIKIVIAVTTIVLLEVLNCELSVRDLLSLWLHFSQMLHLMRF